MQFFLSEQNYTTQNNSCDNEDPDEISHNALEEKGKMKKILTLLQYIILFCKFKQCLFNHQLTPQVQQLRNRIIQHKIIHVIMKTQMKFLTMPWKRKVK